MTTGVAAGLAALAELLGRDGREEVDVMLAAAAVAASGSQRSPSIAARATASRPATGGRPARRRPVGDGQERREADLGVGVVEELDARDDRASTSAGARAGQGGIPPHAGRRMLERGPLSGRRASALACSQRLQAVQGPEGVDGRRCSARGDPSRGRSTSSMRSLDESVLAPLHQQPLGMQPPEHVLVLERRDEPLRIVHRQLRLRRRLPLVATMR